MVQQTGNALGVALIGLVFYSYGFAGSLLYLLASALGGGVVATSPQSSALKSLDAGSSPA